MELETARAMISNPDGWNRDDILKAAIVLNRTVDREKARDHLLLAIASCQLRIMTSVHNLDGCQASNYSGLYEELRNARIIFASTLDRS